MSLIFVNLSKLWHKVEENRPNTGIFTQNTLKSCGLDSTLRVRHDVFSFWFEIKLRTEGHVAPRITAALAKTKTRTTGLF